MHNASVALTNLLNTADQLFIADLLTITPASGSAVYLTSASTDITCVSQVDNASHLFKAGGVDAGGTVRPSFAAGETKVVIGTQVDNLDLSLFSNVLATVGGLPWTQQARLGFFDGARICLERAFTATWGDWSAGTVIRFWGRVGKVQPSRNTIGLTVASDLVLLQLSLPRNTYQPGCLHNLFDSGCTLIRASFAVTGAITIGSTVSSFNTNLTQADGFFGLGTITFTSGANAGLVRTVKTFTHTGGVVVPTATVPVAPIAGDTFSIVPGCDKTQATCTSKFANLAHFRGFPYVPPPEAAS